MSQQFDSLADTKQQQTYTSEEDTSLFISDTAIPFDFNIVQAMSKTDAINPEEGQNKCSTGIHSHSKHKYRNTFGKAHIQYHDFDNGDAFTCRDKYRALLQQELQNPYWCLHNPITTKVTKYPQRWMRRQCPMLCISLAIRTLLQK